MYTDYVMVTDWEEVDVDDFYLSEEWTSGAGEENMVRAKELQAAGQLYIGYVVLAVHYAIFGQMDSSQIFIDRDGDEIMTCEGAVIDSPKKQAFEYE